MLQSAVSVGMNHKPASMACQDDVLRWSQVGHSVCEQSPCWGKISQYQFPNVGCPTCALASIAKAAVLLQEPSTLQNRVARTASSHSGGQFWVYLRMFVDRAALIEMPCAWDLGPLLRWSALHDVPKQRHCSRPLWSWHESQPFCGICFEVN